MALVIFGPIVHTKSFNDFETYTAGFVAVEESGKIAGIGQEEDYYAWQAENTIFGCAKQRRLSAEQFLMPGFVDCHIHAPQVAQIGLGLDLPLLEWLNKYTFPLEAKFSNQDFAACVYPKVVESTIRCGTTLASYFGTNNKCSTLILAKEALKQGQRALIGKVCSDRNSPTFYVETTEHSLADTVDFISEVKKLDTDLVLPTITPRFALSCTADLMSKLGDLARVHNLHIQSHISESIAEIEFVKSLFSSSYAEAYDAAGLLTNKTVMAHGVHLEDDEIALFRERGTSVAHCPASNTMLSSGFCDVQRLIKMGVKVGLGTDVSGGNSMSIQHALLRTLDVSHHLEFIKKQEIKGSGRLTRLDDTYTPLNYKQAVYLATLGGAEALSLDHVTGNFTVGKEFDALIIDTSIYPLHNYSASNMELGINKTLEMVQKFIYVGDDRNIVHVFVAGRQIKDVSGGNSMSIQHALLRTLDVSHHLEFIKKQEIKGSGRLTRLDDTYTPLNYKQAVYLATLGGAEALSLDHVTGNFTVGKEFDALIIDTSIYPLHNYSASNMELGINKTLEMVQKFIYVGDDRNIVHVFVAGRQIKGIW